jgi:peptidoglycan/xylan/chitin deacetylase (PgdA/CDA1 family)
MAFPIMLTFDLDAESGALAQDPANAIRPGVLSIGQYGPKVGVHRILNLLKEEDIPATFFVPGWVIDKYPAAVEAVVKAGHEIGHHGYTHQPPATFTSRAEEEDGLVQGIESVVRATGKKPVGYRSPSWDFSPHTLSLLQQYGFQYSSNLMDDDAPYIHQIDGKLTLVELPIQWMNDDAPFFMFRPPNPRPIQPASHPFEIWTEELQALYAEPGKVFVLTMHPQIIGRPSRVAMLRRFIAFARSIGTVEFRQCADVATEIRQRATR